VIGLVYSTFLGGNSTNICYGGGIEISDLEVFEVFMFQGGAAIYS